MLKFDEQKERRKKGRKIAGRLKTTQPKLARAMSRCRPDNQCQLYGCPSCEWRRGRRTGKILYKVCRAIALTHPNAKYFYLSVALPLIEVEDLTQALELNKTAIQKLLNLKITDLCSVQFTSFVFFSEKISVKTSVILATSGENGFSEYDWNELWRQSSNLPLVPNVEAYPVLRSKIPAITRHVAPCCDLSLCPDEILGDFTVQIQSIFT